MRRVIALMQENALRISNVDVTVIAQAPRLKPYVAVMQACLAVDLEIPINRINVKATTTEGMGFTGRKEGIAAHAVVLLKEIDD